jgi:hypothetical protein
VAAGSGSSGEHLLFLEFQSAHSDQHLVNLRKALLISMYKILGEVLQVLGDDFQSLGVVGRELNFLPQVLGRVRSFRSLNEQIAYSFLFSNCCVQTVGQWTCTSKTKASHVVRVLTESPFTGDFSLERAKALVDDLPHYLVVLHF